MRADPWILILLIPIVAALSCGGSGGGVFDDCGDADITGAEECDDGNNVSCDGCSSDCVFEPGGICGDGVVDPVCGEQCDDGNVVPGDGCDAGCQSELCGNGDPDPGEDCDDGNETSCDGCSPDCEVETGLVCGDGVLNAACGEECDDGNILPGDGCDENCMSELAVAGEYEVFVETVFDTCDFGSGELTTPIRVVELTPGTAEVDIPVGGAGGGCNPQVFTRQNDTLTRIESSTGQVGDCTVQTDVTTQLDFAGNGSVDGSETTTLTEIGGDCSALTLPCQVELEVSGSDCSGCFSCVAPATATPGLGSLGRAVGLRLETLAP